MRGIAFNLGWNTAKAGEENKVIESPYKIYSKEDSEFWLGVDVWEAINEPVEDEK